MGSKGKYTALTNWLQQCHKERIRITFLELNTIIPLPPSAYRDRPSWANCTTKNSTSFQRSWLNAGYCVAQISLVEKWVEFARTDAPKVPSRIKKQRHVPVTHKDEILLTVPDNLVELTMDEFLMVQLTKENAEIVEACIARDPKYQSKGKQVMEHYFSAGDHSANAYYEIINRIATENSTRTSAKTMKCLAVYCANSSNHFLERLKKGDPYLVDDLLQHLVDTGNRKDKSLASKLCRYINEWYFGGCAYTINDSVVRAMLPYYLAYYKIDRTLWLGKKFDELSYIEFYEIFSALRDACGSLNNHQLDHLIWYAYKNDTIRREIGIALAKVLVS